MYPYKYNNTKNMNNNLPNIYENNVAVKQKKKTIYDSNLKLSYLNYPMNNKSHS